jgi:hypothetical protein
MEYNTKRPQIIIPEYGRNVQTMVEFCLTVTDKQEQQTIVAAIIQTMKQVNTSVKDSGELEQTLWNHLHIMSNYELEIDSPYPKPERTAVEERPERLPYTQGTIKFKHYGKNIENMMEAAKNIEKGEMRQAFVRIIVNQMKKNYLIYNNRSGFSDEVILKDFATLSNNELTLADDFEFNQIRVSTNTKRRNTNNRNNGKGNNNRNNKNNTNRNRTNNQRRTN